jgi:hypothetical protein
VYSESVNVFKAVLAARRDKVLHSSSLYRQCSALSLYKVNFTDSDTGMTTDHGDQTKPERVDQLEYTKDKVMKVELCLG